MQMKIPQIWWIFSKSPHICGGKWISGLLNYIYRRMTVTGNMLQVKRKGEIRKGLFGERLIVKNFGNGSKRNFWFPLKKTGGLEADFYCHLCWGRDSVMLTFEAARSLHRREGGHRC